MRAAVFALAILFTASGCPEQAPKQPAQEDTSDETLIQFHTVGQLQYGKWYEAPHGNRACRWRVEWRPAGDDAKLRVLESGNNTDAVRVREEMPGKDVFLRLNSACGQFQEVR